MRMVLSVTCHQYPFNDKPMLHTEREKLKAQDSLKEENKQTH